MATVASNRIVEMLEALKRGEDADIDGILRLDPEIVRLVPMDQLEFLFHMDNNSAGSRHLLSLLPHWAQMDTLRQVVEKLLSDPGKR